MIFTTISLALFDWNGASTALEHAWRVAPGLVVACAAALAIPAVAGLAIAARQTIVNVGRRATRNQPHAQSEQAEMVSTFAHAWVRPDGAAPIELKGTKTLTVVGRNPDSDLVLDDQTVAGHHAAIERTLDDEYWIINLTGPAGTGVSVDNHRVERRRLVGGERIVLGSQRLTFETHLR